MNILQHIAILKQRKLPRCPSYGVYTSQLIRFARASSHVGEFNGHKNFLTAKLFKQDYQYHNLRKVFAKLYRRHFKLIEQIMSV